MLLANVCAGFICCCCEVGGAGSAGSTPHICRTRVKKVCLSLHPPLGVVGGGIICVEIGSNSTVMMLFVPASVGPPSLHGYDACMVLWIQGDPGEVAGKSYVRPLFLPVCFLYLVGTLKNDGGVRFSGIFE